MSSVDPVLEAILCFVYNCNVEKVCSGLKKDVVITSTERHHIAEANLLREVIKVTSLHGCFTRLSHEHVH